MNPKGPLVPQSNILLEFNTQTVGSKGVRNNASQKEIRLPPDFSRNAFACEALREIVSGSEHWKYGVNQIPQFLLPVYSLASINKTVNGYTLAQLFWSKKVKGEHIAA